MSYGVRPSLQKHQESGNASLSQTSARANARIDQALQLQGFPALFTSNPSGLSCGPAPTLICRLPSLPPTEFFRSARARGFLSRDGVFWG